MEATIGYLDEVKGKLKIGPDGKLLYKGDITLLGNIVRELKAPTESNEEFLKRLPRVLKHYIWCSLNG